VIYNNLIYFLVAIFFFSMATTTVKPGLSWWYALPALVILLYAFDGYVRKLYRNNETKQSAGYFKAEKRASIAALLVFAVMVFGLDLKYYLNVVSFDERLPALTNISGLVVFILLFVVIWNRSKTSYEAVFQRSYRKPAFIISHIKANLPIVIPWMILTLCYDMISFIQWDWLQELLRSPWGDVFFFGLFLVFVFIFFPPLVKRLWGCQRIEEGPLRDHLEQFCEKQNFSADYYFWPLFEGRVITAGVMGVIPGLRYILLTPALLETMNRDELDSVMAHEIGHVKRFHLILYVLLIGGFVISTAFLAEPLYYYFFSKDFFYTLVGMTGLSPELIRNGFVAAPSLVLLLLYFRFVFGYFMRNFERQADLHVFPAQGSCVPIINAFEKIAILSGNIRDEPSWHHFGIGERVDFLKQCEKDQTLIKKHHRKVGMSLFFYILLLGSALIFSFQFSYDGLQEVYEQKYVRADLLYDAEQEEYPAHWLFFAGNFFLEHGYEKRAVIAFELSLEREPEQPDILNNYAWLLLTSSDVNLRDPRRALHMARLAAQLKPTGVILDTLATAYWANGFIDEAIKTGKQALFVDPEKAAYYELQIDKFRRFTYREELENGTIGIMPQEETRSTREDT